MSVRDLSFRGMMAGVTWLRAAAVRATAARVARGSAAHPKGPKAGSAPWQPPPRMTRCVADVVVLVGRIPRALYGV